MDPRLRTESSHAPASGRPAYRARTSGPGWQDWLRPLSTVPQFPYSLARLSESCQAMPAKLVHDEPLRLITVISFRIVALG